MDADAVIADAAGCLRVLRASRDVSQRDLARSAGVSKSVLARIESQSAPEAVKGWLRNLDALGLCVPVALQRETDTLVRPPAQRDAAGRLFPAHAVAQRPLMAPSWWYVRHGGWLPSTEPPEWFWRRAYPWEDSQARNAASTTSLASACTCARCSGPLNDSA